VFGNSRLPVTNSMFEDHQHHVAKFRAGALALSVHFGPFVAAVSPLHSVP